MPYPFVSFEALVFEPPKKEQRMSKTSIGGYLAGAALSRFRDLDSAQQLYQEPAFLGLRINDGDQQECGNINFAVWRSSTRR